VAKAAGSRLENCSLDQRTGIGAQALNMMGVVHARRGALAASL
jgi:hypothetical protein